MPQHTDISKNAKATIKCYSLGWSCVTTVTPARTPRLHYNVVMCCLVMWGLFSAMTSSLRNSSDPPQLMETNPPNTACGCPCHRVIKKKITHTILSPFGMCLSIHIQLNMYTRWSSVFSSGTLQQQHKRQHLKSKWLPVLFSKTFIQPPHSHRLRRKTISNIRCC